MSAHRYQELAVKAASQWAQRTLDENMSTIEQQTAATVVLDLIDQVQQLRQERDAAQQLAFSLGGDLLYTLQAQMEEETDDAAAAGNELTPVGYAARGWQRDRERIELADCTEGRQVSEWLDGLAQDHFARES
jgi:hypothetical protein